MPKSVPSVPSAAAAIGPYSVVTEAAGLVFISGQVAFDPATGERVDGDVVAQAERVMENLGLVLGDLGLGYDDIVKTTIFLDSMDDYAAVNEVYGKRFSAGSAPARSAVEAAKLPAGFLVEIEAIAAR